MKPKIIILTLLVLMALAAIPSTAQTITMANPGGLVERDIAVYWPNGSMQGFYNSTSVITLDSSSDYIFTMKPVGADPMSDISGWVSGGLMPWARTNATAIIVLIILLAVAIKFARR